MLHFRLFQVAPLAGSVDRNNEVHQFENYDNMSLPSRGAWIEISTPWMWSAPAASLPSRGAWIEILWTTPVSCGWILSLPSRGAWIEIPQSVRGAEKYKTVAPLAGSVDRNCSTPIPSRRCPWSLPSRGAWIEISVLCQQQYRGRPSLPSRGAWIEMLMTVSKSFPPFVAPLAGSVDRNDGLP